jgi:hypothetical protein
MVVKGSLRSCISNTSLPNMMLHVQSSCRTHTHLAASELAAVGMHLPLLLLRHYAHTSLAPNSCMNSSRMQCQLTQC